MDIDIMFYDDEVIATPRLTIPHPLIQEREFALEPMCELEGERLHPRLGKTLNELYNELRNKQI
jgi:2-amino-4-hydroxy-6-hydroxymethyldihydropteridine diphosphokinase